jgi:hypothetical protein
MSESQDWINDRIEQARRAYPIVTDQAAERLIGLLENHFADRQIARTEMDEIARRLISDMDTPAFEKDE